MPTIFPERESRILEFKSQLPNFQNLIKTCVAFANGTGGKIVIGVDDKTRALVGVSIDTRDRIYDEFPNSVYDATMPALLVDIYEQAFDDGHVIIIDVPSSIRKPVCVKKEGIPAGIYLRAGTSTRKATPEYVEELMRESKRMHFDEEMIQEDTKILSDILLHKIFKKIDMRQLLAEKITTTSSIGGKKYYPTVAGVLGFCESPEHYIPEAMVVCTRFLGKEGRDIIQSEEVRGNLEEQIETSFQLIKSWLMRDYHLIGTKMQAKTIVPEIALREAIANALIHRKYWIPGAVKIALYDNRLEIFSPGEFPGLVDINNLGDGTTYLRNPTLARIARKLGLVEKLGTGIKLMIESCRKAQIKRPEFIEGADSVKVIFWFLPSNEGMQDDIQKLEAFFVMNPVASIGDVSQYLGVSRNSATRKLNELIGAEK